MPIVHEYTADAQVGGPFQTRQARDLDTGNVGSSIANLGSAVSAVGEQIHKRNAQAEISGLNAKISEAHANFTNDLDDTLQSADPADRTISDKFMQDYDDQMDEVGSGISTPEGQAYFERANAQMRSHFQVASMQGQATLAGHQAVQDQNATTNNYSSSLMNDPSSFDTVKNLNDMSIQALVQNETIDPNTASKLTTESQTQLAKSAVRGWINLDPAGAKAQLDSGKWDKYVGGDLKYQLGKEADQGVSAQRIEANRQKSVADQAAADQAEAAKDQMLNKLYGAGLSTNDVLKNQSLSFSDKKMMLGMIDTSKDSKIKTDPGTMISLFNRVNLPEGNPQKITDPDVLNQYFGKGLDISSLQQLRAEIQGRKTPQGEIEAKLKGNFLESIKGQLTKANPMIGIKDPEGDAQYQSFLSNFLPAYDAARKAGKDPVSLLNPQSADYMGKLVSPFVRSPQQILNSMVNQGVPTTQLAPGSTTTQNAAAPANNVRVAPEPRRKGETPDEYRKRTGG